MAYKVARCVQFPSALDRFLERIHRIAKTRAKPAGIKPGEAVPGAAFWVPLHNYSIKAAGRNEAYARQWTSEYYGKPLWERTLERIKEIEKAWPTRCTAPIWLV